MKKVNPEKIAYNRNQRPNKIKLVKKIDSKAQTTIFNSSCTFIPSNNSLSSRIIHNKNNKLSHNSHIHNQSSIINNSTILEYKNTTKGGDYTINSYMNKNPIKNKNHKIINSSFYNIEEDKSKQNKNSFNSSMYNFYHKIRFKDLPNNKNRDIPNSYRSNANNKKEEYKRAYSKKRTEKEIQNKINKMSKNSFGKVNKYEKNQKII